MNKSKEIWHTDPYNQFPPNFQGGGNMSSQQICKCRYKNIWMIANTGCYDLFFCKTVWTEAQQTAPWALRILRYHLEDGLYAISLTQSSLASRSESNVAN